MLARWLTMVGLCGCALACHDGATSPGAADPPVRRMLPAAASPDEQFPDSDEVDMSAIVWVSTQAIAWFDWDLNRPYGAGLTQGYGNDFRQTLEMQVFDKDGNARGTATPHIVGSAGGLPALRSYQDTVHLTVSASCGWSNIATTNSHAKLRVHIPYTPLIFTAGEDFDSDQGAGYMTPCPPPEGGGDPPEYEEVCFSAFLRWEDGTEMYIGEMCFWVEVRQE